LPAQERTSRAGRWLTRLHKRASGARSCWLDRACSRRCCATPVLSRLYVTVTHRLLGGESFHSMIEGAQLQAAGRLNWPLCYLDSASSNGTGQFFAQFEPLHRIGVQA